MSHDFYTPGDGTSWCRKCHCREDELDVDGPCPPLAGTGRAPGVGGSPAPTAAPAESDRLGAELDRALKLVQDVGAALDCRPGTDILEHARGVYRQARKAVRGDEDDTVPPPTDETLRMRRNLHTARRLLQEALDEVDTLGRTGRRIVAFLGEFGDDEEAP